MDTKKFAEKIIEKIKSDHVEPTSRWVIRLKNYSFWIIFGLVIFLGMVFFSLAILNILDIRPEFFRPLKLRGFIRFMFTSMPYIWIILSLLAHFSGILAFRKTKRGYRYSVLFVAVMVVLIFSLSGFLMHATKINKRFEKSFEKRMPEKFKELYPSRDKKFSRPEEGMLFGKVKKIDEHFIIISNMRENRIWTVEINKGITIKDVILERDDIIVIGVKKEKGVFEAESIKIFDPKKMPGRKDIKPELPKLKIKNN